MSLGDVSRLRAFALVADLGSISAAASVLGYTQSAVSQQLAALEREVGEALVDRSQRPLEATHAGELLRPHVERVLAAVGGAEAAVEDLRGGTRRLRLAAFTSALSSFVPAAGRDLRRAPPQLTVQGRHLETHEAVGGPRRARRNPVRGAGLEQGPLTPPRRDTPAGRFRAVVEHLCAQAGFAPRVAYELNDLPAAQAFVAAGIGIVPMHGLPFPASPLGPPSRPPAELPPGSRTIEAFAPIPPPPPVVDDLLDRLA